MTKRSLFFKTLLLAAVLLIPAQLFSQSSNDVQVSGSLAPDKIKKGRVVQGTIVMNIPAGLHVQSSKPLDKFLVATKLDVEAPREMKLGAITYPRAQMRNLKFSKDKVAVYEGRTSIRFNMTVPANYSGGSTEIKGKLRFQACNDESCFPPVTREVKMWLNVE
jgi:thioredoxin:protein disulfide reductase